MPLVYTKYLGTNAYVEPNRMEVIHIRSIWIHHIVPILDQIEKGETNWIKHSSSASLIQLNELETKTFNEFSKKFPYIPEIKIILAASLPKDKNTNEQNIKQNETKKSLAENALVLIQEWGQLTIKGQGSLKNVIYLTKFLAN